MWYVVDFIGANFMLYLVFILVRRYVLVMYINFLMMAPVYTRPLLVTPTQIIRLCGKSCLLCSSQVSILTVLVAYSVVAEECVQTRRD